MKQVAKHLLALLIFVGFAIAPPALAQTPVGTVKGSILSPEGSTIVGAELILTSPQLMGEKVKKSEEGGRFVFQNLPAGIYTLKVNAEGYNPYMRDRIQVDIGRSVILPIFLTAKGSGDVIEIIETGSPTIDTQKTSTSEVLSTDFLEELPQSRNYQSAIQSLPGVTGGSNPNVQGSASDENTILLDGVNITDPVTGTFSMNFNFDAMEQVEVMTGSYGAQYGQSMGGITNITTKSGGNDLEMKFSLQIRDASLSTYYPASYGTGGFQYLASELDAVFRTQETAASVGGPIIKDRLWYFASFTYQRSDLTSIGVQVPRKYQGRYAYGKLTYQPTNDHQFSFAYFTNPTSIDYAFQNQLVDPEAEATQFQGGGLIRMDWNWYVATNTRIQARAYTFTNFINVYPVPCTHDPFNPGKKCESWEDEGAIDLRTIGTLGSLGAHYGENYSGYTYDDRRRRNISGELNHYIPELVGEHQITGGVDATFLDWKYINGYFGNVQSITALYNVNGNPYDPANLVDRYDIERDGPLAWTSKGHQISAFATDKWQPLRNLTINYGLRYDKVAFFNDAGEQVTNISLVSPRVGFAWDPFKDQTTRVFAHVGRYVDSGRFAVSSFINERGSGYKYILGNYYGNSAGSVALFDSGQSTYLAAPNLISPHTDELTFGVEREIIYDIALGVQAVDKRFEHLWEDDEVNFIWNEDATELIGERYSGTIADIYRLRTAAAAVRNYQALNFTARQRFPDKKLQLIASYTLSRLVGNVSSNITATLDVPQQDAYTYGFLPTDRRHVFTGSASYRLPLEFVIGGVATFQSGAPYNLYAWNDWYEDYLNYQEPRGTHARFPNYWRFDTRVTKNFDLREWGRLEASLDLFNLLNSREVLGVRTVTYNAYGILIPTSLQNPRSVQFSLRLEY